MSCSPTVGSETELGSSPTAGGRKCKKILLAEQIAARLREAEILLALGMKVLRLRSFEITGFAMLFAFAARGSSAECG